MMGGDVGSRPSRPALRYYGSKWSLAGWVLRHFPPEYRRLHYIEPYGGSAAVLLQKEPSALETYNDLDSRIVTFFRVLRDRPGELIRSLELSPYARSEYLLAREPATNDLELARRVFVGQWQSISGSPIPARSGWKVQRTIAGRYTPAPIGYGKAIESLHRVASRLRMVQIEQIPALELIGRVDGPDTLLYIDPPYTADSRDQPNTYSFELGDDDHRELAKAILKCSGYVLISGYDSELYRELFDDAGWYRSTTITQDNSGKKQAQEILWINPRLAGRLKQSGINPGERWSTGGWEVADQPGLWNLAAVS